MRKEGLLKARSCLQRRDEQCLCDHFSSRFFFFHVWLLNASNVNARRFRSVRELLYA
jgi:hypothetical protein